MEPVHLDRCILYGIEAVIGVEVVETLARASIKVHGSVLDGSPDWNLESLDPVAPDSIPSDWLDLPCLVTRSWPGLRKIRQQEAEKKGFSNFFSLIDPTAIIPQAFTYGSGCFINAGAIIGGQAVFGDSVYVNRGVTIGHHVQLADYVTVGPGANIASSVQVGAGAMIGTGATIIPKVKIGSNSIVAGGTNVHRDVPPNVLVAGNPAVIKKTDIAGYKGYSV